MRSKISGSKGLLLKSGQASVVLLLTDLNRGVESLSKNIIIR